MDDIVLMHYFEPMADLHQNILDLVLAQSSPFRFDISLEVLLTILKEKVQVLFCFGRFVESYYVWAFQLHQNFNLSSDYLLVFDIFESNCFDGQELVFIVLDVASINSSKTAFSQLDWGNYISLYYLTSHRNLKNNYISTQYQPILDFFLWL